MSIRILIVDDSHIFTRNIKKFLLQNTNSEIQREIVTVSNAVNALNTALDFNPHIVLLDKGLGDNMNGLSLLSALQSLNWRGRKLEWEAPRKVCLVSGDVDDVSTEISEVLGITHVIPKQLQEKMSEKILQMIVEYESQYIIS